MYTQDQQFYVANADRKPIYMIGKMANRHGLIAGATGTGKTVSLQVVAESFCQAGVPCFMADMKGDLSGISQAGTMNKFIEKRCPEFGIKNPVFSACPTQFFDVYGEQGHPMRTTISEMGPQMLSRILELNETQSGILNIIFKIADDQGLLLIDTKDLRLMLDYVAKHSKEYTTTYGNITAQSIGAIQRALFTLDSEGGDKFFGEPSFNIFDLIQTKEGKGMMNVLAADKLMHNPKIYSSFLLWLLSELYTQLPEVGDLPLPKFIFFFDEAHTLFEDTSKSLVDKIEQVVRLVRSKGVGVYFITQNPTDIPDNILGQLGNRIQHALRAFTPNDQKDVIAAARTFRPNPKFKTEDAITELGTGEALVSFLDENGTPTVVEKAKILFPLSSIGAITSQQRDAIIRGSRIYGTYERAYDRESAYEQLTAKNEAEEKKTEAAKQQEEMAKEQAQRQKEEAQRQKEYEQQQREMERRYRTTTSSPRRSAQSPWEKAIGSAASSIGRNLGNQIIRSILGSIFKK